MGKRREKNVTLTPAKLYGLKQFFKWKGTTLAIDGVVKVLGEYADEMLKSAAELEKRSEFVRERVIPKLRSHRIDAERTMAYFVIKLPHSLLEDDD